MNKMLFITLLTITTLSCLTGCGNEEKNEEEINTFNATIIECDEKSMVVRPDESEMEYKSSDKFRISFVDSFSSCNVGSRVKISYTGGINESYPAQVGTYKIEIIE